MPSAAFCDTFDAPAANRGRAGELDVARWSAGRAAPQLPSGNGVATGIGPATPRACRSGLPATVLPPSDALICDANAAIASNHLMVAVGAQNYGQNSYRIRQPFDFAGRTGKIVFDADATVENSLLGWVSLELLEDPTPVPSFVFQTDNDEDGSVPRSGIELQFQHGCLGEAGVSLRALLVYKNYNSTVYPQDAGVPCVPTQRDHLNRFEVRVSQQNIEVWATPASADGRTFANPVRLLNAAVSLPFSRGHVSISAHNHATLKYSNNTMDAWVTRFDNVGFDGPVIQTWREFEVPDALTPGQGAWNRDGPVLSVGYRVADASTGPAQTLRLRNVDLRGAVSARLALSGWYLMSTDFGADPPNAALRYRFNGKAWRERKFTADELKVLTGLSHGQLGQMLDVPLADLVQGDNTLEFVTVNLPQSYPPLVQNIDLILQTN